MKGDYMITKQTNEESVHGNGKYKDRLFRFIFGAKQNRKYLLSLYNAVNLSSPLW